MIHAKKRVNGAENECLWDEKIAGNPTEADNSIACAEVFGFNPAALFREEARRHRSPEVPGRSFYGFAINCQISNIVIFM